MASRMVKHRDPENQAEGCLDESSFDFGESRIEPPKEVESVGGKDAGERFENKQTPESLISIRALRRQNRIDAKIAQ